MTYIFENPVPRGNNIKYNCDHFCKARHNLQRFCNTLFFYNWKKGLFKNVQLVLVCKYVLLKQKECAKYQNITNWIFAICKKIFKAGE